MNLSIIFNNSLSCQMEDFRGGYARVVFTIIVNKCIIWCIGYTLVILST